MEISLVIPYCDQPDFTARCLQKIDQNTTGPLELVLIDNQSKQKSYPQLVAENPKIKMRIVRNEKNNGVLATYKQGLEETSGDIVCFIHNDVLIHEQGWNERVVKAFKDDPKLGLAGLIGARGVAPDGGREGVMSHMLGQEWGACPEGVCNPPHQPVALHHGELMTDVAPAVVFDGVGLFFRREALKELAEKTDMFDDWRAPHHFYDRIFSLKVVDLGWHMAVIGIQFDHWSGATANSSEVYHGFAREWCKKREIDLVENNPDLTVYKLAEKQWMEEFPYRLPAFVSADHTVSWRNPKR